ncbi:MAG: SurA N-terminal domain-containing protein [Bdellovibrionales bacterium]|nr:SurA N-terminal domain-containing protein [Bdellovibrionales bacterium]
MFEKLRRPGRSYKDGVFKKFFSYFVFGAICIVFLFIAPMGSQLTGNNVVAKVGPYRISSRELRNIEENLRRQYQNRMDSDNSVFQKQIRTQALQYLIDSYLIYILTQKEGFFITDQELRDMIQSLPVFQDKGRFLYSQYIAFLKSQNLSPHRFEERIRRSQLGEVMSDLFDKLAPPNDLELVKKAEKYQFKINFQYVELKIEEVEEEKLRDLLKLQDKSGINRFLSQLNIQWKETGVFSLFLPIRQEIAQNKKIREALISYLPETGVIPSLIRDNNKIYIVNVLSFSQQEIDSEEERLERLFSRNFKKSGLLFDSWLSFYEEKIKIQKKDTI